MSNYQEAKKQDVKKAPPPTQTREELPEQQGTACPACSAIIPEGALFCPECGFNLARPVFCPSCGAQATPNGDICQVCHAWLLADQCKFCYANIPHDAAFCAECGNPRNGIQCPGCGNLSIFDFCTRCKRPLTEGAILAIEMAKNDPDAKALVEASQEAIDIGNELAKLDELINVAPEPVEDIPFDDDYTEPEPPPVRKSLFSSNQLSSIMKTGANIEDAKKRKAEEAARAEEIVRKNEEDRRRAEASSAKRVEEVKKRQEAEKRKEEARLEAIRRKEELERERLRAIAEAEAARMRFKNKVFETHQDARRFHNALQPNNPRGWLCNYADVLHEEGPNECADPRQGGVWVL